MQWEGLYKGNESLRGRGRNIEKRIETVEHHLLCTLPPLPDLRKSYFHILYSFYHSLSPNSTDLISGS